MLHAIGGFVVCFRKPGSRVEFLGIRESLKAVQRVAEEGAADGGYFEGVCLAVGMGRGKKNGKDEGFRVGRAEWEDLSMEYGFEYVDGEENGVGRNEFGGMFGCLSFLFCFFFLFEHYVPMF